MDMIREATLDTDEDGIHLILEGDFTNTCIWYLESGNEKPTMEFVLPSEVLEHLRIQIGRIDVR